MLLKILVAMEFEGVKTGLLQEASDK